MNKKLGRRRVLQTGLVLPLLGPGLSRTEAFASAPLDGPRVAATYARLGVKPMINAVGTLTTLSGTLMPDVVKRAMEDASTNFIPVHELQEKVGQRLAELCGAEAAFVTAGASAGLCLASCAVTAGDDRENMRRLPDLTGLKNEMIIQKQHRNSYDHAFRMVGARLVEVETPEEMRRAINRNTAAITFVMSHHTLGGGEWEWVEDHSLGFLDRYVVGPYGRVSLEQTVEIAHAAGLPVILDAAAELPPKENLSKFVKMGVDLVAFSGGKNLRGPQCSGLLLGRKDVVEKAYANSSPHNYFARIAKVGKEEIVGLLAAVEHYLFGRDHQQERREWHAMLTRVAEHLRGIPSVSTEFIYNNDFSHTPRLAVKWDEARLGVSLEEMISSLRTGEPPIVTSDMRRFTPPWEGLGIFAYNLLPSEELIVARRIEQVLRG